MPRQSVYFVRAALVYLGVGMVMGALMLANKGIPFAPVVWRLLSPHVEIVLIGWTAQLVMGVALWILPRIPQPHKYGKTRYGWIAFVLLNAGLMTICLGQWFDNSWLSLVGRGAELSAIVLFVLQVFPRIRAITINSNNSKDGENT